jgi:hypothetical protein
LNLYLRRRELRPLELRQLPTIHWRGGVIVCAATPARRLRSGWHLRHVRRNIQWHGIGLVLGLRGGWLPRDERKRDEANEHNMQTNGDGLGPAEVLVLSPDFFHSDWLYFERQRGLLGRREKFLQASAKPAKTFDQSRG